MQLKITKPACQAVKTIDQVISNLKTEGILISDVLPCLTISDHDALYAILQKLFQTRFKYIRNMKNFKAKEYYSAFSTLHVLQYIVSMIPTVS